MLKKIVCSTLVLVVLSGCATHQQSNELAGAVVGGAIGRQLGGTGGAILGAGMGAAIGGNQPTQPTQVIRQGRVIRREVCTLNNEEYMKQINHCDHMFRNSASYHTQHRDACYTQAKKNAYYCRVEIN